MENESIATTVTPAPASAFRLQLRNVFLTYSQCPLPKETMLQKLQERVIFSGYCIGEEDHKENDGKHLHVYLQFPRKMDIRSAKFFDIDEYHPHIQIPRAKTQVIEYCCKDGNYLSNIEVKETYQGIFKTAKTKDEFLNLVKSSFPRDYALNLQRLEYAANTLYPTDVDEDFVSEYSQFDIPNLLTDWLRGEVMMNFDVCDRCDNVKSVVLPDWTSFNGVLPAIDSFYAYYICT